MARLNECILYRNFEHGEILDKMAELMNAWEQKAPDLKEKEGLFFECANGLVETAGAYGFSGNLWHCYLTFLLVNNENAFSTACEIRGAVNGSINELALNDFGVFKGRYIFYGCGNLKKLEFSDSLMQIGCGAFTGCHALEKLTVHMRQGKKSGVKEMLGEMWQRIDVNFLYEYEEARLVFPEHYDEAVENTPARILYTEYHGSGSNYRQCFYDKELNYQEYDRLFEMAVAMDKLEVLGDMSFGRLEFPYELTGKARENYREYIRKNLGDIAEYLVKQEDMHRLEVISSQKLWTLEGIDSALDCASKRKETEVSAFLMNERANLVDNTAGSEHIDVDKLQNSQEADRTEQGKNEQSQTTEKSLNRRTILRKKRFEL